MDNKYNQPVKEKSRDIIWEKAINSLTLCRSNSKILDNLYLGQLWKYVCNDVLLKNNLVKKINKNYFYEWISYNDSIYQIRYAKDLKIAYYCGEQPENDLKNIIEYGVKIENVYAFELDNSIYRKAVENIKKKFPLLKVFNGNIADFLKICPITFDIIYLDFTASYLSTNAPSPYKIINSIFDNQSLSDLGILIVNTTLPEKNKSSIDFLASFFSSQVFVESNVVVGSANYKNNSDFVPAVIESCLNIDCISKLVEQNFENAYSAFSTQYPALYSNFIMPMYKTINNKIVRKRIFNLTNDDEIKNIKHIISEYSKDDYLLGGDGYLTNYLFLKSIEENDSKICKNWKAYLTNKENGFDFNRSEAGKLYSYFSGFPYSDNTTIINDSFKESINKIMEKIPDRKGGVFCDLPMENLWIDIAINQYGYPYHLNVKNHERYSYIAKTNKMFLDIFTFDKCRSLYNILPMIEFYHSDFSVLEKQLIVRLCLDAITKHSRFVIDGLYNGSSLICYNQKPWAVKHNLKNREEIT